MSRRVQELGKSTGHARSESAHVEEMQRRRLLLAIGEVVGESGLEAATIGRVCEQAGMSRRTFYELYADREECLLAAFEAQVERVAKIVCPVYRGEGEWRDRTRSALTALLEHFDAEPHVARLCVIETLRAGNKVLERRRRVFERLAAAIDEGREESQEGVEPPPLTAQGVVGGALSVIHARLLEVASNRAPSPLIEQAGPLMAMIVHPYLGPAAARKELGLPTQIRSHRESRNSPDPFKGLSIRFTYRTARVLSTIATDPGASNRWIAESSGVADEGQMSRLLGRLCRCGLIENRGEGQPKGEPNAWALTERGEAIHTAIAVGVPTG